MLRHFSLTLQSAIVILYAFFVCRNFLPLRPCFHHKILTGSSLMFFPILLFFIPESLYSYVSLVGFFSMILGCFPFFQGSFREKTDLLLYIYLTGIFIETTFSLMLVALDLLFPAAGLTVASFYSSSHSLTFLLYSLYYLVGFLLVYRKVLPLFKKYRSRLRNAKVFRNLEYIIFIVILSSNIFPLLFLSKKHIGVSILTYLIFSLIVMYYITKNCRIFTYQETQISLMKIRQQQLENEIASYRKYETEFQKLRKQNHDISNHLLTLRILAEQEKWPEIEAYITSIINTAEKE